MLSVASWLIILNVVVFVLDHMIFARPGSVVMTERGPARLNDVPSALFVWGHFSLDTAIHHAQAWRFLSFQFLHANLTHLLGNMIGLFVFGQLIERHLGRRRFLAFYLLCGIAGPVMYVLLQFAGIFPSAAATPMVGASAGVFGILAASAVVAPRQIVHMVFPPMPIRLRTLALVLLGVAAFTVFTHGPNAGGEAAHLGGAALGWLLITRPSLLDWVERYTKKQPRMRLRWD